TITSDAKCRCNKVSDVSPSRGADAPNTSRSEYMPHATDNPARATGSRCKIRTRMGLAFDIVLSKWRPPTTVYLRLDRVGTSPQAKDARRKMTSPSFSAHRERSQRRVSANADLGSHFD